MSLSVRRRSDFKNQPFELNLMASSDSGVSSGSDPDLNELPLDSTDSNCHFKSLPGLGIICALGSGIALAFAGLSVTKMSDIDPTFIMIYRSLVQLVVYALIAIWKNDDVIGYYGE